MCRVALARLHGSGEIVNLLPDIRRDMLQHTGDQADQFRRIHGQESGSRATEVVKTHVLIELGEDARPHHVVDAVITERATSVRGPQSVMVVATKKAGTDLLQIVQKIRLKFWRDAETFGTFCLGILGIEEDVHACGVQLQMPAGGKGFDAASAYQPNADDGQDQTVSILQLPLLTNRRQGERFFRVAMTSAMSWSGRKISFANKASDSNWRKRVVFLAVRSNGIGGSAAAKPLSAAMCSGSALK